MINSSELNYDVYFNFIFLECYTLNLSDTAMVYANISITTNETGFKIQSGFWNFM